MSETSNVVNRLRNRIAYIRKFQSHLRTDAEEEAADLIESQAAEIERLSLVHLDLKNALDEKTAWLAERDRLRQQLADAERQRDQAVELLREGFAFEGQMIIANIQTPFVQKLRKFLTPLPDVEGPERETSSGEEPAASVATCEPMTGEQLCKKFSEFTDAQEFPWSRVSVREQSGWNSLAAHIWPNAQPQPDRREQLRLQVKRTDHEYGVVALQLGDKAAIVQPSVWGWTWWSVQTKYDVVQRPLVEAIAAATEWLVSEALKTEGGRE